MQVPGFGLTYRVSQFLFLTTAATSNCALTISGNEPPSRGQEGEGGGGGEREQGKGEGQGEGIRFDPPKP